MLFIKFWTILFNLNLCSDLYFELQQLLWSSFAIYSSGSYCGSSFTTFKFFIEGDDYLVPVLVAMAMSRWGVLHLVLVLLLHLFFFLQ